MSAYAVTSDIASITKNSRDTLLVKPHNQYVGTELSDEKLNKLYAMYCGLLMMQYAEDCENKLQRIRKQLCTNKINI